MRIETIIGYDIYCFDRNVNKFTENKDVIKIKVKFLEKNGELEYYACIIYNEDKKEVEINDNIKGLIIMKDDLIKLKDKEGRWNHENESQMLWM